MVTCNKPKETSMDLGKNNTARLKKGGEPRRSTNITEFKKDKYSRRSKLPIALATENKN